MQRVGDCKIGLVLPQMCFISSESNAWPAEVQVSIHPCVNLSKPLELALAGAGTGSTGLSTLRILGPACKGGCEELSPSICTPYRVIPWLH